MQSSTIPRDPKHGNLTGTFQEVYPILTLEDKARIARQCVEHLALKRKEHIDLPERKRHRSRCESLDGGAFKTMHVFHWDKTSDELIEPCETSQQLWDHVYMPPSARAKMPQEILSMLRTTMPTLPSPMIPTQLDLSPANVLVECGNFAGFKSHDRAGYFPAWWQRGAIQATYTIPRQAGMNGDVKFTWLPLLASRSFDVVRRDGRVWEHFPILEGSLDESFRWLCLVAGLRSRLNNGEEPSCEEIAEMKVVREKHELRDDLCNQVAKQWELMREEEERELYLREDMERQTMADLRKGTDVLQKLSKGVGGGGGYGEPSAREARHVTQMRLHQVVPNQSG